jgi:hypothetical protein
MRREPYPFRVSAGTVTPHRKKDKNDSDSGGDLLQLFQVFVIEGSITSVNMEDSSNTSGSQMRQPKKRFVGRRTAETQAQKDSTGQNDVESTAVQTGMQDLPALIGQRY